MQIFTALVIIFSVFESFKINKETALALGIGLSTIAFILVLVLLRLIRRRIDKYSILCNLLVGAFFITFVSGLAFLGLATGAWSLWE